MSTDIGALQIVVYYYYYYYYYNYDLFLAHDSMQSARSAIAHSSSSIRPSHGWMSQQEAKLSIG